MKYKNIFIIASLSIISIFGFLYAKKRYIEPKIRFNTAKMAVKDLVAKNEIYSGDIIFQTSLSPQSKAIQLATHSEYSHCGIILKEKEVYFVLEAVQPVKLTPLDKWIAHGKDGHFVIKRVLRECDIELKPELISKIEHFGKEFLGKNYDLYFGWSDDRIYCSELVWKTYKKATGLELGKLQQLKDFDLSNSIVKAKLVERYGDNIPYQDTVISPVSIFNSELLCTVLSK